VENIFINNYTLYECTYHCITYSATAHPDDGQARPKHVGATNWENIYRLCILVVFISNYTTMHGVEHIKLTNQMLRILCLLRTWRPQNNFFYFSITLTSSSCHVSEMLAGFSVTLLFSGNPTWHSQTMNWSTKKFLLSALIYLTYTSLPAWTHLCGIPILIALPYCYFVQFYHFVATSPLVCLYPHVSIYFTAS
jgi:hypothetical protein